MLSHTEILRPVTASRIQEDSVKYDYAGVGPHVYSDITGGEGTNEYEVSAIPLYTPCEIIFC